MSPHLGWKNWEAWNLLQFSFCQQIIFSIATSIFCNGLIQQSIATGSLSFLSSPCFAWESSWPTDCILASLSCFCSFFASNSSNDWYPKWWPFFPVFSLFVWESSQPINCVLATLPVPFSFFCEQLIQQSIAAFLSCLLPFCLGEQLLIDHVLGPFTFFC